MRNKEKTIENKIRHIIKKSNLPKPNFIKIVFADSKIINDIDIFSGESFDLELDPTYTVYIDLEVKSSKELTKFYNNFNRFQTKWFKKYGDMIHFC